MVTLFSNVPSEAMMTKGATARARLPVSQAPTVSAPALAYALTQYV